MECTKAQLLKFAHTAARRIVAATGVSYREALGQGLQQAWASAKAPRNTPVAQRMAKSFIERLPARMMQLKKKSINPVTGAVIVVFAHPSGKEDFVFSYNGFYSFFLAHKSGSPSDITRAKVEFDAQQDIHAICMALMDFLA